MATADVRKNFLISGLFQPSRVQMVYTDLDRLVIGGIMPASDVTLPTYPELRTEYFTEHREVGIINLGDAGEISIAGLVYPLENLECLYIGQGERDIVFRNSARGGQAAFYLLSAPAHRKFQTVRATLADASVQELGTAESASKRKLVQYIHEGGIQSCQLVMGYTTDFGILKWPSSAV